VEVSYAARHAPILRGRIAPPLAAGAPRWRRTLRVGVRLIQGLYYHDAFQAAPAMAFHFFLSLLPLLVFVGYVVGSIARSRGVEAVLGPLLDRLPAASERIVKNEVGRLAGANALGPIAAVGFLWLAAGGVHGLMDALEAVVSAPRRPWWRKRILAGGWVVASLCAFWGASWGVVEWDSFIHPPAVILTPAMSDTPPARAPATATATAPAPATPIAAGPEATATSGVHALRHRVKLLRSASERALALGGSLVGCVAALATFYWFSVSHPSRVKRRVLPGAVLAVFLWLVISWGFSLYVTTLTDYAVFYGSVAAVAVLLVWLWLTSLAILVGAELNAQLEGLRD
jgi:membrane protein